jgi:hypothetical protein
MYCDVLTNDGGINQDSAKSMDSSTAPVFQIHPLEMMNGERPLNLAVMAGE